MATYEEILAQLEALFSLIEDLRRAAEEIQEVLEEDQVDPILDELNQISSELEEAELILNNEDYDLPIHPTVEKYQEMLDWAHMAEDSVRDAIGEIQSDLKELQGELEKNGNEHVAEIVRRNLSLLNNLKTKFWHFYHIMIGAA